jgi:predicted amidophosphoribosyltransferase
VVEDVSRSRRKTFVAVVGGAALLLGVLGLILVLRSRRRARSDLAPGQAPMQIAPQSSAPPPSPAMICPTCRSEYPLPAQFCENDGNRLVPFAPGSDLRGPTGGICPVCGQGYDPGVSACPKHLEELVPVAVWTARSQQPATVMICPICGTQYPGDGRFCGSDGAALVPVN